MPKTLKKNIDSNSWSGSLMSRIFSNNSLSSIYNREKNDHQRKRRRRSTKNNPKTADKWRKKTKDIE